MYHDLRLPAKQAFQDHEWKLQKATTMWLKKELFNRGLPQLAFHCPNERKATPEAKIRNEGNEPETSLKS